MAAQLRIHVCLGVHCSANGSQSTLAAFEQAVRETELSEEVEIVATSCRDRCDWGPSVNVYPGLRMYCHVRPGDAAAIVADGLLGSDESAGLICEPWMRRRS